MKSFDEWLDTTKLRGYMDENSLEAAWEAGQQSKQAEADDLKRELLNRTNEAYADGQRSMRKMIKSNEDELQKNFNNALKTIEIQQRFLDDADGANKILTSQASELQKRIDGARMWCEKGCVLKAMEILKGENHES